MKNLTRNCFLKSIPYSPENGCLLVILLKEIAENLKRGGSVVLTGFGVLKVRDKAGRPGRNPKTGESFPIDACRTVILGKTNVDPSELGGIRMTRDHLAVEMATYGFDKTVAELRAFVTHFIDWVAVPDIKRNIQFRNFGTFKWRERKAGMVKCPSTGKRVWSEATVLPVFKPGKELKELIDDYRL